MKYRIEKLNDQINYINEKKNFSLNGYAFIGEHEKCMFIIWGDNRKNIIIKTIMENASIA